MQDHRTDEELPPSPANLSPPIANVHGLGESHALRVDLLPVQVPWLADEVRVLRASVREALAVARTSSEREAEVARRSYQLRVLGMIRDQLPLTDEVVAACVGDPWRPDDRALEAARITSSVTVVGPARGMLVLVRGSARNVADALGEALRGAAASVGSNATSARYLTRWPELHSLRGPVAARLRDLASAASAFTDTYVAAVAQQGYVFDPDHYPVYPDDLW